MYTPRLPLKPWQTEALYRIASKPQGSDVFALLMDMGTGKSATVLAEWGRRVETGELNSLLVVAPAGSYSNWFMDRSEDELSEATKHLDPALRADMRVMNWRSGGGVGWQDNFSKFMAERDRPRMLVVNTEAFSTVAMARAMCEKFLDSSRALMCLDESTRIRNDSKRTKHIINIGRAAAARRIATGLVAPRSPLDVFYQFNFLDPRVLGDNWYAFRAQYAILKKMRFNLKGPMATVVVGYRNVEQIKRRIAPWSFRKLKEECLELEPKVFTTRDVALTLDQARIYKDLKRYATAKLDDEAYVSAGLAITQILRLHQLLCGYVVSEAGDIHPVSENRTAALIEILEEHDGKAIIWVAYDYTVRRLRETLAAEFEDENIVAAYWGGNKSTRDAEETRFKTDPRCRFMISTEGSGGIGNNWTVANLVVYFSNTYDLELRAQSEDRAHRMGQVNKVTYVDLVARGTVDEKILYALRKKINLATAITGENYKEWVI
jgi:SNF2 family DNA or RNA helicase